MGVAESQAPIFSGQGVDWVTGVRPTSGEGYKCVLGNSVTALPLPTHIILYPYTRDCQNRPRQQAY